MPFEGATFNLSLRDLISAKLNENWQCCSLIQPQTAHKISNLRINLNLHNLIFKDAPKRNENAAVHQRNVYFP